MYSHVLWVKLLFLLLGAAQKSPTAKSWYCEVSSLYIRVHNDADTEEAAVRALAAPRWPLLLGIPHPAYSPGLNVSSPGPSAALQRQWWPKPCPAQPWVLPSQAHLWGHGPSWPHPIHIPKEVHDVWNWGCPQCPQAVLLLAGAVGWSWAARPCPDTLGGITVEAQRELLTFAVPWQWSERMVSISVGELRRGRE